MQFFRLQNEQVHANQPLPWNVYNQQKQLLIHKGFVLDASRVQTLIELGMYVDQSDFDHHQRNPSTDDSAPANSATALWQTVQKKMEQVLTRAAWDADEFNQALDVCNTNILHALSDKTDASLFELLHDDDPETYAVQHALQCSFVSGLVSSRMGLSDNDKQTLTSASLTMNVGMAALQSTLSKQASPLSLHQRQQVNDHGKLSRELLEQHGVSNQDWLRAIEQHHVTDNGGPLPADKPANELACMMHYVDVYLAKVSSRSYRPAIPAFQAMRELFIKADGPNNPYVSALVKELGVYPPGSCVKLSNGEISVVVRKGEAAHTPWVRSIVNSNGSPMHEPDLRDTSKNQFKVMTGVARHKLARQINRHQLFA